MKYTVVVSTHTVHEDSNMWVRGDDVVTHVEAESPMLAAKVAVREMEQRQEALNATIEEAAKEEGIEFVPEEVGFEPELVFEGALTPKEFRADDLPGRMVMERSSLEAIASRGCRDLPEAWGCMKKNGFSKEKTHFDPNKHLVLHGTDQTKPQAGEEVISYRFLGRAGGPLHS